MSKRIAINGMGVIGREMLRTLFGQEGIEIVCINDPNIKPDNLAYLLKYDSVYHKTTPVITANENSIIIGGKEIRLYDYNDPKNLPLGNLGADYVLECTATLGSKEKLNGFINAGAKRVIACYMAGSEIPLFVPNVNLEKCTPADTIIAIPEMEVQVSAAALKIINDAYEIECGFAKAFRSYTNAQPTMDSLCNEFARGRAASCNITPINDVFAKGIGKVVPELNGKIEGFAYRSPVINGSIMDITVKTHKNTYHEALKATLKEYSNASLQYNEDPLCSSDAMSFASPQILASQNKVAGTYSDGNLVNISIVYDNIRGYCNQMSCFWKWAIKNDW